MKDCKGVNAVGVVRQPDPVKLFIAVLYQKRSTLQGALPSLQAQLGPVEWQSEELPFTHTDYYRDIGYPLTRSFLVFKHCIDPGNIVETKLFTNTVEELTGDQQHKRRMNLDPGYFDGSKIVLATTKNFSHRVYIGKGIYGEATIKWEKGDFRPFEYTYPDYAGDDYRPVLWKIRELHRRSRAS